MYVHGWSLPREIDPERWARIHTAASTALAADDRLTQDDRGFVRWMPSVARPRERLRNSA